MFSNVAVDVFIGLIFIYLLYSLLTTIMMEFIAHYMSLRARLLVKAMRRMLEDNQPDIFGRRSRWTVLDIFSDFKESIKRFFYPFQNLPFLQRFYHHPTIKYLGESKSSSKPSYMQSGNFSQTMIQIFRGRDFRAGQDEMAAIEKFLFVTAPSITLEYERYKHWILNLKKLEKILIKKQQPDEVADELDKFSNKLRYKPRRELIQKLAAEIRLLQSKADIQQSINSLDPVIKLLDEKISPDTLHHFQNLFKDAQYNFQAFRQIMESWFDETMQRVTGWYKRQTQVILLVLGFTLAIIGNVDTLKIYSILSQDKDARDQMVSLAIQSQEKYEDAVRRVQERAGKEGRTGTAADSVTVNGKLTTGDTLLDRTYKLLQDDMKNAGSILGLGWCSTDSCKKYQHQVDSLNKLKDQVGKDKDRKEALEKQIEEKESVRNSFENDWDGWSLIGWFITALAISLGAPFWFDMLNKVTRIRSSGVKETTTPGSERTASPQPVSATVRSNQPSNSDEEAVG